jgi:hypothetical protein
MYWGLILPRRAADFSLQTRLGLASLPPEPFATAALHRLDATAAGELNGWQFSDKAPGRPHARAAVLAEPE